MHVQVGQADTGLPHVCAVFGEVDWAELACYSQAELHCSGRMR